MVVSFYELTYPRTYDFGAQSRPFTFQLPAKSAGYLLNITDVPLINGYTPVLYDMTNGLRYTAVVNPDNSLSFVLGGSSSTTQLVLVNEDPATVQSVTGFTVKNFTNYADRRQPGQLCHYLQFDLEYELVRRAIIRCRTIRITAARRRAAASIRQS